MNDVIALTPFLHTIIKKIEIKRFLFVVFFFRGCHGGELTPLAAAG